MDRSFRVYVDIFSKENDTDEIEKEDTLEKKLKSYEVVPEGVILREGQNEGLHDESRENLYPGSDPFVAQIRSTTKENEKLCGFLKVHKTGDKIQHRKRWFVFSEEKCRLLYFKTPEDIIPRCDIDISSSSFYISELSENGSQFNKFEIRTKDCTYFLEAADQKTMLYWLQELQKYREKFVKERSRTITFGLDMFKDSCVAEGSDNCDAPVLMENVPLPKNTVGPQTKDTRRGVGSGLLITNIRDDLRKMISSLWYQKQTDPTYVKSPVVDENDKSSMQTFKQAIRNKTSDVKQKILRNRKSSEESKEERTSHPCLKCAHYEEQLNNTRDEMFSMDEELQATREVTRILQKQIDEFMREQMIHCSLRESGDASSTQTDMLCQQEKKIVNLEHLLAISIEEKAILSACKVSLEGEVEGLKDQINAYRDSIQTKDEVVINLTEQLMIYENRFGVKSDVLENVPQKASSSRHIGSKLTATSESQTSSTVNNVKNKELQKYEDMVNGYKTQNQFLNKEILELNQLRQQDSITLQELTQTCLKLETRYYDEHRKYLSSLKELGKQQCEDDPKSLEILESLLKDAMISQSQWDHSRNTKYDKQIKASTGSADMEVENEVEYDEIGFPKTTSEMFENDTFDEKLATVELQSDELYIKAKSIEEGLNCSLQWEKYMTNVGLGTDIQRSKELKEMIRRGIPQAHRPAVWKWCVNDQVKHLKNGFRRNYYENLIVELKNDFYSLMDSTAKQIELDLLRTLPTNKYFENFLSDKVQSLRRILLAFSVHDPVIGYCQGLNRIAAIALLFLNEEDSFWCLVAIVNCLLLNNYFSAGMQGAHTDQRVLRDLLQEKLPTLSTHLKQCNVDVTVFTFNWFLTIYIDNIPPQMYLRIWDSFLYEGSKVLFRYAIAFFKHKEADILSLSDMSQVHLYLRSLGQKMIDVNQISKIAFEGMNPFPKKIIDTKRQHHLVVVKAELQKMQEQRESYRKKRQINRSPDLNSFEEL